MICRRTGPFNQFLDNCRGSGDVWITDAEVDQVNTSGQSLTFSPIDFGEQIRR